MVQFLEFEKLSMMKMMILQFKGDRISSNLNSVYLCIVR
jgi:hypothetical protein